jgi:hypothetical protein
MDIGSGVYEIRYRNKVAKVSSQTSKLYLNVEQKYGTLFSEQQVPNHPTVTMHLRSLP